VTVGLSFDGKFNIYNEFGAVDVLIDVVGYYDDHDHDDRYFFKQESTQMDFGIAEGPITIAPPDGPTVIAAARLGFLGQGTIVSNASATYNVGGVANGTEQVTCTLGDDTTTVASSGAVFGTNETLAITAGLVPLEVAVDIELICTATGGPVTLTNGSVTATYTPLANFGE